MNCVAHQSPGHVAAPDDQSWRYKDLTLLDRARQAARARRVRRHLHRRRARHLRRLRRQRRGRDPARRAGAGQRPAAAGPGDGRGHRAPRLRRHRRDRLRAPVPVRAPHVDARPPHQGPRRLEHRHRLPARAPPATWATTTSSSTTTATTSPTSTSRCSTSCGRAPGRTTPSCATARRGVFTDPAKVHDIGHTGKHFTRAGHPPLRAVAAAHAGDLPGRRVAARHRASPRRTPRRSSSPRPPRRSCASTVANIRDALEAAGRDRYSAKIYTLLDDHHRRDRREGAAPSTTSTCRYASDEGALVFMSGWMGIDLSQLRPRRAGRQRRRATPSSRRSRTSSRPTTTAASGPCATSPSGARSAASARASSAPASEVADQLQEWVDGDRRRRLQPRLRDHAGHLRGRRRARRPGAARARRLPVGLRAGHAAQQAARPRRPAARGAPRRAVPGGWSRLDDHRAPVDGALLLGFGRLSAGQREVARPLRRQPLPVPARADANSPEYP